jgi:hypothetical protein
MDEWKERRKVENRLSKINEPLCFCCKLQAKRHGGFARGGTRRLLENDIMDNSTSRLFLFCYSPHLISHTAQPCKPKIYQDIFSNINPVPVLCLSCKWCPPLRAKIYLRLILRSCLKCHLNV